MILKTLSGQAELTADALVIRTKKGDRTLPFDTVETVEYVAPKNFMSGGHIRPLLVGDTTRSAHVNLDRNFFIPVAVTKEDRANTVAFAHLLIDRVCVSKPKRIHPELADLASDPAALRRAQASVAAEARRVEASIAAEARMAAAKADRQARRALEAAAETERRQAATIAVQAKRDAIEAEFVLKYPDLDQQINGTLAAAVKHAAAGAVVSEHGSLRQAVLSAKAVAGRRGVERAERAIERLRGQGKVLIGVSRLGVVEPEGRFSATERTNSLGGLLSGGGVPIEVLSDRVIHGDSCRPIDEHTRAEVYLDGERQTVSRNPFNSRRENTEDRRQASFQVAGPNWTFQVPVDPDKLQGPRALAAQINAVADKRRAAGSVAVVPHAFASSKASNVPARSTSAPKAEPTVVEQLERLAALRGTGVIDEHEFANLKSALLSVPKPH